VCNVQSLLHYNYHDYLIVAMTITANNVMYRLILKILQMIHCYFAIWH